MKLLMSTGVIQMHYYIIVDLIDAEVDHTKLMHLFV
jgi:hypothetical protein